MRVLTPHKHLGVLLSNDLPRKSRALSIVARWDRSINGHHYAHVTLGNCFRKAFCTRVEISGASIINYKSTLICPVLKSAPSIFPTTLIMSKVIHLDWFRGMTLHLRIGSNLSISVKITSVYYKCLNLSKVTLLQTFKINGNSCMYSCISQKT